MNRQQRTIVRDFIDIHNGSVKKYLRDVGMLNNNGTLPLLEETQTELESWFVNAVHAADFNCVGSGEEWFIEFEISGSCSKSGNPDEFAFDASAFDCFRYYTYPHQSEEDCYYNPIILIK